MVSTTVFASGILNDLKTKDYNNGEKIELSKKPFIENCEVYVPLQEMFDKIGIMNNDKLINFSPIFTFVSLDVTSLETNDTLKITKKNDLDFVTDLLENSNYENKPCDGIADYRITYNNSTYDILMSCHEIKRGNKQAEITDNDIEKLKNVFANAKQTK